jgi:hypothetical protein
MLIQLILRNLCVCKVNAIYFMTKTEEIIFHTYNKFPTFHPAFFNNILGTFTNCLCSVQNLFTSSRLIDLSLTRQSQPNT